MRGRTDIGSATSRLLLESNSHLDRVEEALTESKRADTSFIGEDVLRCLIEIPEAPAKLRPPHFTSTPHPPFVVRHMPNALASRCHSACFPSSSPPPSKDCNTAPSTRNSERLSYTTARQGDPFEGKDQGKLRQATYEETPGSKSSVNIRNGEDTAGKGSKLRTLRENRAVSSYWTAERRERGRR